MTTQSTVFPGQILLEKWREHGFVWRGEVAIDRLPRLQAQVDAALQTEHCPSFGLHCRLHKTEGVLWLVFQLTGVAQLLCHRCLQPMTYDLSGEYRLAIVDHERELEYVNDDEAYVMVSELDGDGRMLPILTLLEDELILALPLSAHHDDCQMLMHFDEASEQPASNDDDNPFAVLASLKSTAKIKN